MGWVGLGVRGVRGVVEFASFGFRCGHPLRDLGSECANPTPE